MMNCALPPWRPEPRRTETRSTSGSALSMSATRCWRPIICSKLTVVLELARPQIRPVSWAGKAPFLTAPISITVATISTSGVSASSQARRSEKSSRRV